MKFKIKHLLILMFIAASVAFFAQPKKPKFRHETLEDAVEIASFSDWQLLETAGDQQGPFRKQHTFHFGRNAKGYSFVYMVDGTEQKYVTPNEYVSWNLKVVFFQNRKGNNLCMLFGQK